MTIVYGVVGLLLALGLLGSVLPFIPGTPFILAGALVYAAATGFEPVGPWHLLVLTVLAGCSYGLDHVAGAFGVQRLGGSRWAMLGAVLGGLVGIFFGLPGLILGPFIGAGGTEFLRSRNLRTSLRSGLGTILGMILGTAARLALAVVMVGLVLWWVLRGQPVG